MNALAAEDTGPMFRLAALFLAEHADRLDNDGFNGWEWPEWVPEASRVRILSSMTAGLDSAVEMAEAFRTGPPNNAMARVLAEVFEQLGVIAMEQQAIITALTDLGVAEVFEPSAANALIPGDWVYWSDRRVLVLPDRPEDPPHDGYTSVWSPHLQAGGLAPTSLLRREPSKPKS